MFARRGSEKKLVRWRTSRPELREPYAATSLAMHFKARDQDGRMFRERTIGARTYRYYADQGRRLGSVWSDIPAMSANTPLRAEGTGYPTQKPQRLLERIVLLASDEGDTVADLMCGSGTTLVAAAVHGRRFVGADESKLALRTTRKRLDAAGIPYLTTG
jgi:site-specific DNA-methyltransferase (adenine-specific)